MRRGTAVGTVLLIAICLIAVAGVGFLVGGTVMFAKASSLRNRCSATAWGTVVELVDSAARDAERKARELELANAKSSMGAPNDAIAAKKREWQAKKDAENLALEREASPTWHAIVEYEVAGETFRTRSVRACSRNSFKMGQAVQVFHDPGKPSRCWLDLDGLPRSLGLTLMGAGAVIAVIAAAFWFAYPTLVELAAAATG